MERPPFVRRTKHSGVGHEDIGYAYVVIRRGTRPNIPDIKVGRLGAVGKRQMMLEGVKRPLVELELDDGDPETPPEPAVAGTFPEKTLELHDPNPVEIDSLLEAEAFHWPRLVFPPLKKSGHVVMDVCAPSGTGLFFLVYSSELTPEYRQNSAYDHPKVPREAVVLRCPQVRLG
jgi:hypothetical protein